MSLVQWTVTGIVPGIVSGILQWNVASATSGASSFALTAVELERAQRAAAALAAGVRRAADDIPWVRLLIARLVWRSKCIYMCMYNIYAYVYIYIYIYIHAHTDVYIS